MATWTPQKIKKHRMKMDLSQPAFGRLIGVTGNYVYLMEKGVKKPSTTLSLLLDCIVRENLKQKGGEKSG